MNYHEWLDTLLPSVRDELDDLPDDERLARVIQINAEQETRRKKELDEAPTRRTWPRSSSWFEDLSWQSRQKLLTPLSEQRRQYLERLADKPHAPARCSGMWTTAVRWSRSSAAWAAYRDRLSAV